MRRILSPSLRLLAATIGLRLAAMSVPAVAAASMLIWPINPTIPPDRSAAALWLENRGREPAVMQVRVLRWTQKDGDDRYDDQMAVLASPPIMRIMPGTRQLVRLTTAPGSRDAGEAAYRVIIDEVPTAPATAADKADAAVAPHPAAIRFQMRYSIPLFLYGDAMRMAPGAQGATDAPDLRCSLVMEGGAKVIRFANLGRVHARLTDMRLEEQAGTTDLKNGALAYILPGSMESWALPAGATGNEPLSMTVNGSARRVTISGCAE